VKTSDVTPILALFLYFSSRYFASFLGLTTSSKGYFSSFTGSSFFFSSLVISYSPKLTISSGYENSDYVLASNLIIFLVDCLFFRGECFLGEVGDGRVSSVPEIIEF
jgi:hypothetical protein